MQIKRNLKIMSSLGFFGILSTALTALAAESSDEVWQTPAIANYGKIHVGSDSDVAYAVSPHNTSKLVFQITSAAESPQHVDADLERVARSINLYVADGVPLNRMDCIVMLGQKSAAVALNDQRYRERFGIANPNLDLLNKLHAAGVKIVVSGQALADQHWNKSDLTPSAATALSSLTAVTALVQNGYTVMPI